jgi:hypothetical protein
MSETELTIVAVLVAAALLCQFVYIPVLDRWNYSPRWTHITVIIGNFLIGMTFLVFCILGILPWLAFWLLVYTNVAWGLPIIHWYGRKQEQDTEEAKEYHNGNGK